MSDQLASIHRLRISLDNVEPPLWRRLEIESDCPLDFVADVIRNSFGWSFTHGCKFTIKRRDYGTHNDWVRFDPEQEYEERHRQLRKQKLGPRQYRPALDQLSDWMESLPQPDDAEEDAIPLLSELVRRAGAKFTFVFDFGDWWQHTVRVEKIEPAAPNTVYPSCVDGAGANPLEDCGGPWNLMAVFAAVKHPELSRNETIKHIVENWVGDGWDFTRFSVEEATQRLSGMFSSVPGTALRRGKT